MSDILFIFMICLANWRISSLFARELGAYNIFLIIREKFANSKFLVISKLYGGIICIWCNSIWFATIYFILGCIMQRFEWIDFYYIIPFISTATILIESINSFLLERKSV